MEWLLTVSSSRLLRNVMVIELLLLSLQVLNHAQAASPSIVLELPVPNERDLH